MSELALHAWVARGVVAVAVLTFVALFFVTAPYGRHGRGGWGPSLPAKLAWVLMELPSVALFAALFATGRHAAELVPLVLLGLWQLHYVQRTLIYPLRFQGAAKPVPVSVVAMGASFNVVNSWLNARWIGHLGSYGADWLLDPRFLLGAAVFLFGFVLNVRSDTILLHLRRPGQTGYSIPQGGLFRWVSAPNYLGEILEWAGWALATWSFAGLSFFVFTVANLAPRAWSNHRWYQKTFPDYPPERRALIPGLW